MIEDTKLALLFEIEDTHRQLDSWQAKINRCRHIPIVRSIGRLPLNSHQIKVNYQRDRLNAAREYLIATTENR